jgi:hypothetical protein
MAYTTINKSTDYFDTTLITGNGSTQNITGLGFQPDWIWMKRRNATGHNRLIDSVRGSNKLIQSDLTNAEGTDATYVTSFNSDGWSIGTNTDINATGGTAVGWSWLGANGTASNTDGSITSTVSANQTAGFSIVSWTANAVTGSTIGHGLGVKPNMIILKNRSPDTASWPVYHSSLGATKFLSLNLTNASSTSSTRWDNEEPSSTVFKTGSSGDVKGDNSGEPFIAYCFAEKKGYSKFGSYEGNGNANGTFVYTGFKPAWIMTKMSSGVQTWNIFDNRRNGYNPTERNLQANLNNAEDTGRDLDILSNGFKQRNGGAEGNGNNSTYIYMAFAAEPLVANVGQSIPATAR